MPIYDYQCNACKNTFEKILKIKDRLTPTYSACACGGVISQAIFEPPPVGDSLKLGIKKMAPGFNDILKGIKSGNKNSTIEIRGN